MPNDDDSWRPAQDGVQRVETKADAEEPADVKAAREFVQDAASVASALWVSYLGIMVYIAIAVGAVTHADLFLERPVKLPLLGDTPLPLLAFFILAPIAFIIWHAYTLLHFGILAEKVAEFVATPGYREVFLWRLPANIFLQLLVGPPPLRGGRIGFVSAAIAWISLVIGPILLLLLIQIQFLPFHSWTVTLTHRAIIALDLILLWTLWPVVVPHGKQRTAPGRRFGWTALPAAGATAVVLIVSGLVVTFPGEWAERYSGVKWIPPNQFTAGLGARDKLDQPVWTSLHDLLVNGPYDERNQRRRSLFSNTLVLPDFDALGDDSTKQTIVRKWGHFEQAIFRGADLRNVNFENAHLEGASFYQVKMQRAQLYNADLEGADFYQAALQEASFNSAKLGRVNLQGADLSHADLFQAGLEGASLKQANLTQANFLEARLQASNLDGASAQCAVLKEADLRGATFRSANLQAATFASAQMEGSSLENAVLQGADLSNSNLGVARFVGTRIWRADFAGAEANAIIAVGLKVEKEDAAGRDADFKALAIWGDDPKCVGDQLAQPRNQASRASVPRTGKMGDSDQSFEREALADRLANLVCSARDQDVHNVLYGLLRDDDGGSTVRDAGPQAKRFFERILDSNCPAAAYLTSDDKKAMMDLKSAILLGERQR